MSSKLPKPVAIRYRESTLRRIRDCVALENAIERETARKAGRGVRRVTRDIVIGADLMRGLERRRIAARELGLDPNAILAEARGEGESRSDDYSGPPAVLAPNVDD